VHVFAEETTDDRGEGHDIHGRPGRHRAHGLGGAWAPARCTRSRQEIRAHRGLGRTFRWCPAPKGVPGNEKRPTSGPSSSRRSRRTRLYQPKTGHCPTGQYLNWTRSRPTAKCWWCPYRTQTWEHVFKKPTPLEGPTEDPVGRGSDRNWEGEEPVHDPGPLADNYEVQLVGTGLPLHCGCGKVGPGPGPGWGRCAEWSVRVGAEAKRRGAEGED